MDVLVVYILAFILFVVVMVGLFASEPLDTKTPEPPEEQETCPRTNGRVTWTGPEAGSWSCDDRHSRSTKAEQGPG